MLSYFYRPSNKALINRAALFSILDGYADARTQISASKPFTEDLGHDPRSPWAGTFIDRCFFQAGLEVPSCTYPPTGLAEFMKRGRFFPASSQPRLGDIAFLSVPSGVNKAFEIPGAGIITDLSHYRQTGQAGTIEAGVTAGNPKQVTIEGVYRRTRSSHEIIGYGRPDYSKTRKPMTAPISAPTIALDNIRSPRRNVDIGRVQLALARVVSLRPNVTKDLYDSATQDAYAHWQRRLGYVGTAVTGTPDRRSLETLGAVTGLFSVSRT